jgi:hypothetical protein
MFWKDVKVFSPQHPTEVRSSITSGGGLLRHFPLTLGQLTSTPSAELDECVVAVQEHGHKAEKGAGSQSGT